MLKNLLKTWSIEDEFEIHTQGAHGILKLSKMGFTRDLDEIRIAKDKDTPYALSALDKAKLQRYLQECIEARGWSWMIVSGYDGCTVEFDATVWVEEDEYLVEAKTTAHEALLTAYLTALGAQRLITKGKWRHFKGDVMDVLGVAKWSGTPNLMDAKGFYELEEFPTSVIAYGGEGLYFSRVDHGDRVFCSHNGKNWARRVDSFLGLVGPEYPESEGLLRFAEVGN